MKKKTMSLLAVGALVCTSLAGCGGTAKQEEGGEVSKEVAISVTTTFAGKTATPRTIKTQSRR